MKEYLIIIEKAGENYSAHSPDLPGCVAAGMTLEEAESNMHAAIDMHLQGLREDNLPIPEPTSKAGYYRIKEDPNGLKEQT
jgi:predicted RNase H-like HicB family nuclease